VTQFGHGVALCRAVLQVELLTEVLRSVCKRRRRIGSEQVRRGDRVT